MRVKFFGLLTLCLLLITAQTAFASKNTEALAHKAVSAEPTESAPAIAELRAMGPTGLQTLIDTYQDQIKRHIEHPTQNDSAEWRRLSNTLDAVSQQKDSYLSQLYWYTDLNEAESAARASTKPILSLRLLGKLSEEFSCANSRFFRALLYSNAEVSKTLRDRYILHWQTVRAVPRITIDFGDGRKLERTITGNSIHYVLDSDGHMIDALPGLYGPAAFLRNLSDAEKVFTKINGKNEFERNFLLWTFHQGRANAISVAWVHDTDAIGGKLPEGISIAKGANGEAILVMPLAATKAATETSMLRSMTAGADALGRITDEAAWTKIARGHAEDARLDAQTVSLIQRQTANLLSTSDGSGLSREAKLTNLVQKLETSVALDSVRNEYLMHSKLHAWLAIDRGRTTLDQFNERVYAELFLTPRSDPWLGLLAQDVYTGLENGGVVR